MDPLLEKIYAMTAEECRQCARHVMLGGGRGTGRFEAIQLARDYPNVYLDFSGDIFCFELIEKLVAVAPPSKILFGSDYPWVDPAAHLARVLLADISAAVKQKILRDNAMCVYRIPQTRCCALRRPADEMRHEKIRRKHRGAKC